MFHLATRGGGIWLKTISHQPIKYHLLTARFSATRLPTQSATQKDESSSDDELRNVHSVAVPVNLQPTVDVTKRFGPGAVLPLGEESASELKDESSSGLKDDSTKRGKRKFVELPWMITPSPDLSRLGKYYMMLSKSRLTSLVVITSMAGYAVAPAPFALSTFILCSVGTGLLSAAANAVNQYHEVPFDAQMSRTKNRVLVKGILTPMHAVGFAIGAASTGLTILYFGVNGLTATLGCANFFLYTSIYTPMKRFSILNTWVGSIVGAIPPLMGWAGCAGTLDAGAWILAGLLYAWQFPHFNALSWNLRPDYSRAGYRMMSVTNPALCRRTALRYTAVIGALSLAAPFYDVTNMWFALETLPLNAYFGYLAWKFYKNSDSGSSRKLFRFSLIHLPALMLLFLLNKKRWIFAEEKTTIQQLALVNEDALANSSKTLALKDTSPVVVSTSLATSTAATPAAVIVTSPLGKMLPTTSAQQPPV